MSQFLLEEVVEDDPDSVSDHESDDEVCEMREIVTTANNSQQLSSCWSSTPQNTLSVYGSMSLNQSTYTFSFSCFTF